MAAEKTAYDTADQAASVGLPQLDPSTWVNQIFWLVVVFAVLYFLLSMFILPRLREGISDREDRISDDLDQAATMDRQAEVAEANIRNIKTKALANIESIAAETAVDVVSTLTGKAPTAAAVRAAMTN